MNRSFGSASGARRRNEGGATRVKFIVILAMVALVGYMGFQYIPVAVNASWYKSKMDDVLRDGANGTVPVEQRPGWVKERLKTIAKDYGVPPDAEIDSTIRDGRLEATVKFTRPINLLPFWTYNYNFEYRARADSF